MTPENQELEQMTEAALFRPKFLQKDCRKQEIQHFYLVLLGFGFILIAKKGYFKEVREEIR